jgi:polygalacturonase
MVRFLVSSHPSEEGATLRFSRDPSAYLPVVLTRWEGVELMNYSPLNNDGCNPESSTDVLIEDSLFDTGDDCIAIKSMKTEHPSASLQERRANPPTRRGPPGPAPAGG